MYECTFRPGVTRKFLFIVTLHHRVGLTTENYKSHEEILLALHRVIAGFQNGSHPQRPLAFARSLAHSSPKRMSFRSIKATAPGKIILHGEHAVVYGKV